MSVLQIFRGDDFLEEVVLARAVMGLGRHPQNDIVLDDRSLSRFHARVERRGDRFVVVDCGAQNGVHLNGERVQGESSLSPGDRITLGRYVAVFDSVARGATPPKFDLTKPLPADGKKVPKLSELDAEIEALEVDVAIDDEGDPTRKAKHKDIVDRAHEEGELAERTVKKSEPTLVLLFNGMEVSRHPVPADGLTIGRSKQSDVVISLLGLSRKHAQLRRTKDGITVEDLGSQNGTWVNNQRISGQKKLKHGDLLNFYDYAVLFLEDGDVEVGFPGPMFQPPQNGADADDLANKETNRSGAAPAAPKGGRPPTSKGPVPIADSVLPPAAAKKNGHNPLESASELVDLGEGSFLGDEFEEHSGKEAHPSSLLEEDALDDLGAALDDPGLEAKGGDKTNATDVVDDFNPDSEIKNANLDDSGGFESLAGTEGEQQQFEDKTSSQVHARGHAWATDSDVVKALSNGPDNVLVQIEVTLAGKNFTQMPLSQTATRVGTDARCELSLPKSSGLMPWHMTLLHLGGAVVLYRAARAGKIQLAESDIDMSILKDGDMIDLGKVKLKIRMK